MFRIASRTKASRVWHYLGYLVMGKQLQSRCWIRFIERLAERCGSKIDGSIHVRTRKVEPEPDDPKGHDTPVYSCEGDGGGGD